MGSAAGVPQPADPPAHRVAASRVAPPTLGAIEGGGTKFVLLAGNGPDDVFGRHVIPTTRPEETLARCITFFQDVQKERALVAVGVGMFGPVDLNPTSPTYGFIMATPKAGWSNTDVVGPLRSALRVPIGWEHDVGAALLGERRWGAAKGLDPVLYLTVGTGVGGGAFVNGAPLHGLLHPEMGHLLMPALPGDDFPGVCPFHGRCLEGLVSGPAIARRAGRPGDALPSDDPIWSVVAEYLAIALADYTLVLSPRRIVIGGGVLRQQQLLPLVRAALQRHLAGYVQHPLVVQRPEEYIVGAALGDDSGIFGAVEVARASAGTR